jgi:hypothetical protein
MASKELALTKPMRYNDHPYARVPLASELGTQDIRRGAVVRLSTVKAACSERRQQPIERQGATVAHKA